MKTNLRLNGKRLHLKFKIVDDRARWKYYHIALLPYESEFFIFGGVFQDRRDDLPWSWYDTFNSSWVKRRTRRELQQAILERVKVYFRVEEDA